MSHLSVSPSAFSSSASLSPLFAAPSLTNLRSLDSSLAYYYSSIGGGAAPFGPPQFEMGTLENGALLKSCLRHIRRPAINKRNRYADERSPSTASDRSTRTGKLYCRSGYHLQIHGDGKVNGTRQENNRFGVLEFLSVAFGLVSIKGKESNRYLCMNKRGRLYGSSRYTGECIFMEKMLENYYNTYTSCRYGRGRHTKKKWYVAINKRGRPKRGNQSRKKHRFTQFLVLHLDHQDLRWTRRQFVFPSKDVYLGLNNFAQDWRRRQPWERISSMSTPQQGSSIRNFTVGSMGGTSRRLAVANSSTGTLGRYKRDTPPSFRLNFDEFEEPW